MRMGGIRIPKVNRKSVLVTPLLKESARLQPQKSVRKRQEGGPRGGEVDGAVREVRQREMIQVSGGLRDGGEEGRGEAEGDDSSEWGASRWGGLGER